MFGEMFYEKFLVGMSSKIIVNNYVCILLQKLLKTGLDSPVK